MMINGEKLDITKSMSEEQLLKFLHATTVLGDQCKIWTGYDLEVEIMSFIANQCRSELTKRGRVIPDFPEGVQ